MRRTSCTVTMIGDFLVDFTSKIQPRMAQSSGTGDDEYYAVCSCAGKGLSVRGLLQELGCELILQLRCDAKAARGI
eukprot:16120597-Heterocapsa_arctica.AAC.1